MKAPRIVIEAATNRVLDREPTGTTGQFSFKRLAQEILPRAQEIGPTEQIVAFVIDDTMVRYIVERTTTSAPPPSASAQHIAAIIRKHMMVRGHGVSRARAKAAAAEIVKDLERLP